MAGGGTKLGPVVGGVVAGVVGLGVLGLALVWATRHVRKKLGGTSTNVVRVLRVCACACVAVCWVCCECVSVYVHCLSPSPALSAHALTCHPTQSNSPAITRNTPPYARLQVSPLPPSPNGTGVSPTAMAPLIARSSPTSISGGATGSASQVREAAPALRTRGSSGHGLVLGAPPAGLVHAKTLSTRLVNVHPFGDMPSSSV